MPGPSAVSARSSQPVRVGRGRGAALEALLGLEVAAAGVGRGDRVHRRHRAGLPERQQRRQLRVQAEPGVAGQQRGRRRRRWSGAALRRLGSLAGTTTLSPSMPPRRKTTTSVRVVVAGSANEYRVVTSWVPSAATPTAPAPAMTRRRVKPLSQRAFSRGQVGADLLGLDPQRGVGQGRAVPAQLGAPAAPWRPVLGRRAAVRRVGAVSAVATRQSWPHRSAW